MHWLDDHNGAVTAVATMFIAFFTIALAIVSKRQAKLMGAQIELARDEFTATHRPRLIVSGFFMKNRDLPIGEQVRFSFVVHNIGESAATIVEIKSCTTVLKSDKEIPENSGIPHTETINIMLQSGQHKVFTSNGGSAIVENESVEIYAGDSKLICVGTIVYVASSETIRRTIGFCRRYRPRERTWQIEPGEYDYAY